MDDEHHSEMLEKIGVKSSEELIDQTIPKQIRLDKDLSLSKPLSEYEMLQYSKELASKNILFDNYIGFGYNDTVFPAVIQRNIFENPSWYTAYTPYQAEIAQGRLEALLNFQTIMVDLTGLPISNASLLDEGTAAAEAMSMFFANITSEQKKKGANKFFVSELVFPQTISVLKTRASGLGIEIVVGDHLNVNLDETFYGILLQYVGKNGEVIDYTQFVSKCKEKDIQIAITCDPMALVIMKSPAEMGADCAVGSTQRFGIPMGYGGPHAAFFTCKEKYKRNLPGRIIGVSKDSRGKTALRMALQTREQHIKREKATSNICTSQVLLAVMASMYVVYHGPKGLKFIANSLHYKANAVREILNYLGYNTCKNDVFDTISFKLSEEDKKKLKLYLEEHKINLNYFTPETVSISINETSTVKRIQKLIDLLANFKKKETVSLNIEEKYSFSKNLLRNNEILENEVFNTYHTETSLMRYIKKLERKDLSLTHSMISLGSCTMKLTASAEMLPLSWSNWGAIHPFAPKNQAIGYQELIKELENDLANITGFYATSLQPNSGAQGEYVGLMIIREFHKSKGEDHRNVVLIPQSAHGTNPASATMAGMRVVIVKNLENGEIDLEDLKLKVEDNKDNLSAIMLTYPSTYGFFDENVREITELIHQNGGQVYMDGANMNAQVGLTNPNMIGADVCHLNLHKTFAIPHGGGGPGVGPVCVREHLKEFLPSNPNTEMKMKSSIGAVSSATYGSALVLSISHAYIKMLGSEGLKNATIKAIVNANYLKDRLKEYYSILYTNKNFRVAHECIIDFRQFKSLGIEVSDVAKRLIDYGFHAPTVSFPVAGTMMIEPTESENKEELDKFVEALINIRREIDEIAQGKADSKNNVLKNSPHTLEVISSDEWKMPYTREKAAFPLSWVRENKFFASVSRVDDAFGDRNLVCTCTPVEEYI